MVVAAGYDELKTLPIKWTARTVSPILSHIANNILRCGIFPNDLKLAKITLIYNGGS